MPILQRYHIAAKLHLCVVIRQITGGDSTLALGSGKLSGRDILKTNKDGGLWKLP
jgi:hypothetical protein